MSDGNDTHDQSSPHKSAHGFDLEKIPSIDLDARFNFDNCKFPTEEDLGEVQLRLQKLAMKHGSSEAELSSLRSDYEGAQNELQRIRDENGFLKALIADPDMHKGCIAQKNAIMEDLNAKIKSMEEELKYIHQANKCAQADALVAELKCNKMSFNKDELGNKIKQLQSELVETQAKLHELEAEKQARTDEINKHQAMQPTDFLERNSCSDSANTNRMTTEAIRDIDAGPQEPVTKDQFEQLKTHVVLLEMLIELHERNSVSQNDVTELKEKLQASQSDIEKLKQAYKKTRSHQKTACKATEEMTENSRGQDQKIAELQAEIQPLRETHQQFHMLLDLLNNIPSFEALPERRNAWQVDNHKEPNEGEVNQAQAIINNVPYGGYGHVWQPGVDTHSHGSGNARQSMESSTTDVRDPLGLALSETRKDLGAMISKGKRQVALAEKLRKREA